MTSISASPALVASEMTYFIPGTPLIARSSAEREVAGLVVEVGLDRPDAPRRLLLLLSQLVGLRSAAL